MKRIFTFAIAALSIAVIAFSCKKGGSIKDELVPPGPTITHPDSTVITVNVPTTTTGIVKMVGNMKDPGPTWDVTDVSNNSSLMLNQVSPGVYQRQIQASWFVKGDLEFKFVNGNSWSKEELNASGSPIANRTFKKADLQGKKVTFTVVKFAP